MLAAVILTRIVWVAIYGTTMRTLFHQERTMAVTTVKGGTVVSWCGMRGIVTLASAFALPEDFPYRDLIARPWPSCLDWSSGTDTAAVDIHPELEGGQFCRPRGRARAKSIARHLRKSMAIRPRKPKFCGSSTARC